MSGMKCIDIQEFRDFGFLQELNRQFLHPLGMALVVSMDTETPGASWTLHSVYDYRDDPEGMIFDFSGDDEMNAERLARAERVKDFAAAKHETRQKLLGYVVQPVPGFQE